MCRTVGFTRIERLAISSVRGLKKLRMDKCLGVMLGWQR